jgi:hypothetical protein
MDVSRALFVEKISGYPTIIKRFVKVHHTGSTAQKAIIWRLQLLLLGRKVKVL